MKSKTPLAAAMIAAFMSTGGAIAAETSAPKTVAEANAQSEARLSNVMYRMPPRHALPPGNVRAENLRELLADTVSVSRDIEFREPVEDLHIVFTGRDGQVVTCRKDGWSDDTTRHWSWTAGKVRGKDGTVRPVVRWQARSPGVGEGPLGLLHDGGTGEVVWHSIDKGAFLGTLTWVHRFSGHLQERLPAATWTLCPDFPSAEELGVGVNDAQTATSYERLVAQDPGRRIRRPDLLSADVAEADAGLSTWIEAIIGSWSEADGHALSSWTRTDVPTRMAFVFYEPLSAVWELDTGDLDKASGARVRSARDLSGILRIRAVSGWPRLMPEYDVADERHPLAVKHDRLIGGTLAQEVAGLPVGTRFEASGAVSHPDGADRESAWECGAAGSVPELEPATWRSHGEIIEIVRSGRDGTGIWLDDLVAALEDDGLRKPQAELTAAEEIECLRGALGRARVRIRELAANLEEVKAENTLLEALLKEAMKQ